jgi:hypothetical protein
MMPQKLNFFLSIELIEITLLRKKQLKTARECLRYRFRNRVSQLSNKLLLSDFIFPIVI